MMMMMMKAFFPFSQLRTHRTEIERERERNENRLSHRSNAFCLFNSLGLKASLGTQNESIMKHKTFHHHWSLVLYLAHISLCLCDCNHKTAESSPVLRMQSTDGDDDDDEEGGRIVVLFFLYFPFYFILLLDGAICFKPFPPF